MWLRVGIASVLLLYALVSTASISSREDDTEVTPKSKLPLVVSIPSKVSRANKLNSNDIFASSSFHGRTKLMAHSFPSESSTRERTAATTESTTISTTTTTTSTTTASTTTTEAPEATTTTEKPSSLSEDSAHSVHEHDVASKAPTESESTSTTEGTTLISTTLATTDANHETTVILTSTPTEAVDVANASFTKPAEEVVERDYGQSLGNQHSEEGAREVGGLNDDSGHTVDLDSPVRSEESASGLLEENQTANAEERVAVEEPAEVEERVDADIADEVDPMDEAAQASEVDYAVVAPDISAALQSQVPEHRSADWDSEAVEEGTLKVSGQNAPSVKKNDSNSNDTDVRTSSTYSVAVLHPLGVFDSSEKTPEVAIPKERDSFKKAMEKSLLDPRPDNASSAAILLPIQDSNGTKEDIPERTVVVVLDSDSVTNFAGSPSADKTTSSAANGSSALQSFHPKASDSERIRSSKKFSKSTEVDNKDLDLAESSNDSPFILDPERGEEGLNTGEVSALSSNPEASLADEPTLLDSEVGASHDDPEVANEEGEYEYIYEYIDVNATDAPADIPEEILLVHNGQQAAPIAQLPAELPLPAEEVAPLTELGDNSSQARIAPDGSRPPSFRNFDPLGATLIPEISGNETVSDLGQVGFQPLESDRPIPVQAIHPIVEEPSVAFRPEEGSLPFIPGLPESPVYFVGLQREKILPGEVLPVPVPALSKNPASGHDSNALLDGKLEKGSGNGKGDEEQLNALYALSRALPLDDNLPFLISSDGDANATVFLPPNLPDPFSDELLGEARKPEPVFTTTFAAPTTTSEELLTTTTTIITTTTTTTELPTTLTTVAVTEAEVAPSVEEKPVTKTPKRGPRPGGRRRQTTTTTVAPTFAETTAATVSVPARRGSRPSRVGGRRKTTAAAHSDADGTTHVPETTTIPEVSEKPSGADRSRFGSRGRGRLAAQTTTKAATTEEANTSAPSKDKESNTIANGGPRRPLTTRRNNRVSADASSTNGEKDTTSTRASGPARGGRRPQLSRNGEGKTTAAPTASESDAEATTTTRKASIFRPRGRGRLQPKSKAGANHEQPEATEQSAGETHAAAESSANERKEESPVASAPKEESVSESESTQAVADSDAASTENPTTESSGPPRKFPPRFRPGARAAVPHRSTETSN